MTNTKLKAPKNSKKGVFLRLCKYIFNYWYLFLPAVVFTLFSNQLSLLGPKYSGAAIDAIVSENGVDFATVFENAGKMLFCYLASAILSYILSVIMVRMSQKIIYTMRKQLFEKLTSLPIRYFDSHHTGDIISHISYDIDTVNGSLSHDLVQIMTSIYTVVGSLLFMWNISKPLIAVFGVTIPISLIFTIYRSKKVRPLFRERSKNLASLMATQRKCFPDAELFKPILAKKRFRGDLTSVIATLWMLIIRLIITPVLCIQQ